MKVKAKFLTGLLGGALFALPIAGFSSCELVREDLAECPTPILELRFVYDYNMEFANAFHNQVDCLSAYFFDADGHLVTVEKVTDKLILEDEDFRMHPDLPAGEYRVVAYGGMECDKASFSHANQLVEGTHFSNIHVQLDNDCLENHDRRRLHNHFYGSADFTVDAQNDTRATVRMMRNTNTIQVALQHDDGSPIDCDDFIFEITDDNNDFDHENNLLATGEIKYSPWETLNTSTGTTDEDNGDDVRAQEWHAALARFTTSRLVSRGVNGKTVAATLHVLRAVDRTPVFEIPLTNYMLMFKHDNTDLGLDYIMGDQEYLDRENRWNFVFFLKDNLWLDSHIIVNDWEVRLNDTEF